MGTRTKIIGTIGIIVSIIVLGFLGNASLGKGSLGALGNLTIKPKTYRLGVCIVPWTKEMPTISSADITKEIAKLNDYFKEVSYRKASFTATYFEAPVWTGSLPTDSPSEVRDAVQACDRGIDFRNINAFIIFPSVYVMSANVGGGFGGQKNIQTDEGSFLSMPIVQLGGYTPATNALSNSFLYDIVGHELLHALFKIAPHANGLECQDQSYRKGRNGCSTIEYGNPFDILAKINRATHMSAWTKVLIDNWASKQEVTLDGTYSLGAMELASLDNKVLRVPYAQNPLCIEYRKPVGADRALSTESLAGNNIPHYGLEPEGCLLVELCSLKGDKSRERILIDAHPNSIPSFDDAPQKDFYDACIRRGESFANEALGLSVNLKSIDERNNRAQVSLKIDRTLLDKPDVAVQLEAGRDVCQFTTPFTVSVVNNSELTDGGQGPLNLKVFGIDRNGQETLLDQKNVAMPRADNPLIFTYSVSQYQAVRAAIDTDHVLQESNEENNTAGYERNCFV
ncbi:MAG: hypothetical protein AAB592_04095 [Patescibacteria group bacterium]